VKDLQTLFVIKTRVRDGRNEFADVFSKEEFKTYPTETQILNEMTRWSLMYNVCYSEVEKRYRLAY
jgi:hypothetical protein